MKIIDEETIALIRRALEAAEGADVCACIGCNAVIGEGRDTPEGTHGEHDDGCEVAQALDALDQLHEAPGKERP